MSALLTGVIGVVATLLGSLTIYLFQSRTAGRAEAASRNELEAAEERFEMAVRDHQPRLQH
jgi:hypothetical protein